eukprot:CAMPEP_0184555792 /NCGR_PEP_ID=MMETSP0199_2-20130426/38424_1 /TAXON_ID=1112570 /ORGANISM="Thraustochytrium sp., Strain LLF1b" /LENGTH=32 /DNA_ID= /DNA_START= /DNA_END= /DNA_ORIENTATION=
MTNHVQLDLAARHVALLCGVGAKVEEALTGQH